MENNKRIMLSLVLVTVIAVAAIGIGYAYTAMTENSDNTVTPEYITLVQGGDGAYNFAPTNGSEAALQHVYWNSKDYIVGDQPKTDFTLTGVVDKTSVTDYDLVQVGKDFTLIPTSVGASSIPTITIDIIAEKFSMPSEGTVLIMKTTTNGTYQYFKLVSDNTFSEMATGGNSITVVKNGSTYCPITVQMYYGYLSLDGKITVDHAKGVAPVGPTENPVDGAKLTFRINTPGANGAESPALTSISVDALTKYVAIGDTVNITVTLNPGDADNQSLTCSSETSSVATVSSETIVGNAGTATLTITGVAKGTSVITITSDEGSYTQNVLVTVQDYSITYALTNATTNGPITINNGMALETTFEANPNYSLPASIGVTINDSTMTEGTDYTWNNSDGVLNIAADKIIGDIVITVDATPQS